MNICGCGCGKEVKRRFASGHQNRVRDIKLEKNPHWRGGRYANDNGYVMVYMPEHKRATANGYVREHLLIAERILGKPMPEKAQVHHYGNVSDNSQMIICENQEYHALIHVRTKALQESGHASWRKCKFCQHYDNPDNLHIKQIVSNGQRDGWNIHHQSCETKYEWKRKHGVKTISA